MVQYLHFRILKFPSTKLTKHPLDSLTFHVPTRILDHISIPHSNHTFSIVQLIYISVYIYITHIYIYITHIYICITYIYHIYIYIIYIYISHIYIYISHICIYIIYLYHIYIYIRPTPSYCTFWLLSRPRRGIEPGECVLNLEPGEGMPCRTRLGAKPVVKLLGEILG